MKRILIVDDDESIRSLLVDFFRSLNYDVLVSPDGTDALRNLRRYEVDCIISDLVMPDMDGIELLKKVRAENSQIPFVIITGYPTFDTAIEAIKQGAQDYIAKPFQLDDVRFKVERILHIKSLEKSNKKLTGIAWAVLISIPIWLILGIIFGKIWR
jgi:DNA-binding NtrC family response regulator